MKRIKRDKVEPKHAIVASHNSADDFDYIGPFDSVDELARVLSLDEIPDEYKLKSGEAAC